MEELFAARLHTKATQNRQEIIEKFIQTTVVRCTVQAELQAGGGHFACSVESNTLPSVIEFHTIHKEVIPLIKERLKQFAFTNVSINYKFGDTYSTIKLEW